MNFIELYSATWRRNNPGDSAGSHHLHRLLSLTSLGGAANTRTTRPPSMAVCACRFIRRRLSGSKRPSIGKAWRWEKGKVKAKRDRHSEKRNRPLKTGEDYSGTNTGGAFVLIRAQEVLRSPGSRVGLGFRGDRGEKRFCANLIRK